MTDTRKDARLKVLLLARYREPAQDQPVEGECRDLSPSGMYVMTPQPSSPGALIRFECTSQVPGGDFSGTGRVVWNRMSDDASGPPGMGVRFVKLEQGSREAIAFLVERTRGGPALAPRATGGAAAPPSPGETSSVPPRAPFAHRRSPTLQGIGIEVVGVQRTPSGTPLSGRAPRRTISMAPVEEAVIPGASRKTISSAPPLAPTVPDAPVRVPSDPASDMASSRPTTPLPSVTPPSPPPAPAPPVERRRSSSNPHLSFLLSSKGPRPLAPAPQTESGTLRDRLRRNNQAGAEPTDRSRAAARIAALASATRAEDAGRGGRARRNERADAETVAKSDAEPSARPNSNPPLQRGEASRGRTSDRPPAPGVTDDLRVRPKGAAGENGAQAQGGPDALSAGGPNGDAPASATGPSKARVEQLEASALPTPAEQAPRSRTTTWFILAALLLIAVAAVKVLGARRATVRPAARPAPAATIAGPAQQAQPAAEAQPQAVSVEDPTPEPAAVLDSPAVGVEPAAAAKPRSEPTVAGEPRQQGLAEVTPAPKAPDAKPAPAKTESRAHEPKDKPAAAHRDKAAVAAPAPAQVPAKAEAPQAPTKAETPQSPAKAETPRAEPTPTSQLRQALQCMSRGDNACVIGALEGKAASPYELELLIATYRSLGDLTKAKREMRRYRERFPAGPRATEYERMLDRQASEAAPKPTDSPPP